MRLVCLRLTLAVRVFRAVRSLASRITKAIMVKQTFDDRLAFWTLGMHLFTHSFSEFA